MPAMSVFLIVFSTLPFILIVLAGMGDIVGACRAKCSKGGGMDPDYVDNYTKQGDAPLGKGACGTAWKVKKNGTEELYVAKEF